MRLAIGGPTRDIVPASFAQAAANLFAYTREFGPWDKDVHLDLKPATYIHVGREKFLDDWRKQGATHVLWLDTDMEFPQYLAVSLAMHERPIVACNYRVRQASTLFTACSDGERVSTDAESTGLEAVEYCGMGAMLMRTDVVKDLPRPWFRHGLNADGADIGEDVFFCRGLRAMGYTIYIDHDLSKEVGHIGLNTFRTIEAAEVSVEH